MNAVILLRIVLIAFTICSKIWDTALGIIVPSPWKKPRITPKTATITRTGTKTFNAKIQSGVLSSVPVIKSAPK
mgnify:CR=1 FL=1